MSNEKSIPTRESIAPEYKWRLADIYATDEAWESDFAATSAAIKDMTQVQTSLSPAAESILGVLRALDALYETAERLYSYARMRRDEDSRQTGPQAMADRAESLIVRVSAATAFLRPALLQMPEALLRSCAEHPDFAAYSRILEDVLRSRPHTLPAEQEALLAEASEVGGASETIFTMLTEADLRFPKILGEHGMETEVSEARFHTLLTSHDARVRKDAYEAVMHTYSTYGNTLAATYGTSVKNDVFVARSHRFGSSLEASLFGSEIPVAVYDALLTAINERLPALNRYLRLKQRALGLDALHLWDLYVDTTTNFSLKLSYDDAYSLVVDAVAPLGQAYTETLLHAKDSGWVDVYENVGKHHGAYSWGPYGTHPYVLMNFEGTLDSASTLAHELGHSMHSYLSNRAQPHAKADYTLFSAEVASTVNEILLSTHLLKKYPEKAAQQSLLGSLLEHFRTTVFRQTLFAAFEKKAHEMQEHGEALTNEALSDLYYGLNVQYYGDTCIVDDPVRHEWMRIPHFYRAFYVYQYATGFSAAVSIARRILREGQPAVEGYMRFLSAGGSLPPLDALRLAGVDMATPAPVREALDWFEDILMEFERVQA
ncbi:oligoendopeptidase F [Eubacteriales bacterium OttesenSCG-928-A19]|nr:oligoendopeptidase F [Eubacteriales bacterium OttesenSCG-928-A19]